MSITETNGVASKTAPGPKGWPILGSIPELRRERHHFFERSRQTFGDLVRFKAGPFNLIVLAHPDHVRHVLVENKENYSKGQGYRKVRLLLGDGLFVSEGALWQKQRRLMQPPFTAKAVPAFTTYMVESTLSMLKRWHGFHNRKEKFELNQEMVRITMSIIGKTMLGLDLAEEGPAVSKALLTVLQYVGANSLGAIDIPLSVPTPSNLRFKRSLRILDGIVEKVMMHQKEHPEDDSHLLAKMVKARDPETGEGMSARQIRDEIITIFLAGHETTALVLTWAWYLLSLNPEVEEKLFAEIDSLGGAPRPEDLSRLAYTRAVVEETMRLYPPVWTFPREAVKDDVIGGFRVPKGSIVLLCQYLAHRHPDFWEEPERFNPERFLDGKTDRHRNAYFPFGAGPRTCIGNHFAMMEATIILATIAQVFEVRTVEGQSIQPSSVATFRPANGVWVKLRERTKRAAPSRY